MRWHRGLALALLVAESLPDQKTLMIRLIEHFLLLQEPADVRGEDEYTAQD